MVALTTSDRQDAYGILKAGHIGGALLYGPPGTGKTQLARVLARETRSKAVMIHASMAEIEESLVGQTEKIIKAIFKLGRMLSPAIIFIDEADALFKARGSTDRGYERTRISQLLAETDGMARDAATNPPFLLLATNFPHQLDNAVLRRVPGRLFIGMPSLDSRERIFRISLRNELIDRDLKLRELAIRTKGYTGSDIRTVCIQAALICEDGLGHQDGTLKRVLRDEHFQQALRRSGPTVSRKLLADIKEFATEFDPAALEKLNFVEPDTSDQSDQKGNNTSAMASLEKSDAKLGLDLNAQQAFPKKFTIPRLVAETKHDIMLDRAWEFASPETHELSREVDFAQKEIVKTLRSRDYYSYQPLSDPNAEKIIWNTRRLILRIRLLYLFLGKGLEPLQGSLDISSPFSQLNYTPG